VVLTFLKGETRTKRRRVEAKQQHTHILTCSCEGREEGREGMSGWGHAEKEEKKRNNIRRGKTHRSHLLSPMSDFLFVCRPVIDWSVGVCHSFFSDCSCCFHQGRRWKKL